MKPTKKKGLGGAIAASSYGLGFAGYISPNEQLEEGMEYEQPETVLLALKLIVGPIPAFLLLLSFIPLYFYPITKNKHKSILRHLIENERD